MSNNVYVDKNTGEKVQILNEEPTFYVLDNSVRIKKEVFAKKYEQTAEIDPDSFFAPKYTTDPLANIANQIKSLDPYKVNESSQGTQVKYTPPVVLSDNSMSQSVVKQAQIEEQIHLTPEQKKAMLEEWRKTQPGAQIPEVQERNWDAEDDRFLNGDKPIIVKPKVEEPKVDPLQMMFKMFKNNYPVTINLKIEEKIPNPTFIGMVQENVEGDAIEYYANLISDKFLSDPSKLKTEIYNQLKSIVNKELGIADIIVEEKIIIPSVPPEEREKLNEGVDKK
jgi:hypothetical protein